MKTFIIIFSFLFSFPLLAQEITCEFGQYKYAEVLHFSLTQINKKRSLTKTGVKTATTRKTQVLNYWPDLHNYGIKEVKKALKEFNCDIAKTKIKCELQEPDGTCDQDLKLMRISDDSVIHTIAEIKGKDMNQVLKDFREAGICQ